MDGVNSDNALSIQTFIFINTLLGHDVYKYLQNRYIIETFVKIKL